MDGGRPLSSLDELLSMAILDAADGRLVAGDVERLFSEVLLDVRLKMVDQRSSSIRSVIWRSVAELMAGMLW